MSALTLGQPNAPQDCVDHTGLAGGRQTQAGQYPYGLAARAGVANWHHSVGQGGTLSGFGVGGVGTQMVPEGGNSKRQRLA